jgi:hypothetical protein
VRSGLKFTAVHGTSLIAKNAAMGAMMPYFAGPGVVAGLWGVSTVGVGMAVGATTTYFARRVLEELVYENNQKHNDLNKDTLDFATQRFHERFNSIRDAEKQKLTYPIRKISKLRYFQDIEFTFKAFINSLQVEGWKREYFQISNEQPLECFNVQLRHIKPNGQQPQAQYLGILNRYKEPMQDLMRGVINSRIGVDSEMIIRFGQVNFDLVGERNNWQGSSDQFNYYVEKIKGIKNALVKIHAELGKLTYDLTMKYKKVKGEGLGPITLDFIKGYDDLYRELFKEQNEIEERLFRPFTRSSLDVRGIMMDSIRTLGRVAEITGRTVVSSLKNVNRDNVYDAGKATVARWAPIVTLFQERPTVAIGATAIALASVYQTDFDPSSILFTLDETIIKYGWKLVKQLPDLLPFYIPGMDVFVLTCDMVFNSELQFLEATFKAARSFIGAIPYATNMIALNQFARTYQWVEFTITKVLSQVLAIRQTNVSKVKWYLLVTTLVAQVLVLGNLIRKTTFDQIMALIPAHNWEEGFIWEMRQWWNSGQELQPVPLTPEICACLIANVEPGYKARVTQACETLATKPRDIQAINDLFVGKNAKLTKYITILDRPMSTQVRVWDTITPLLGNRHTIYDDVCKLAEHKGNGKSLARFNLNQLQEQFPSAQLIQHSEELQYLKKTLPYQADFFAQKVSGVVGWFTTRETSTVGEILDFTTAATHLYAQPAIMNPEEFGNGLHATSPWIIERIASLFWNRDELKLAKWLKQVFTTVAYNTYNAETNAGQILATIRDAIPPKTAFEHLFFEDLEYKFNDMGPREGLIFARILIDTLPDGWLGKKQALVAKLQNLMNAQEKDFAVNFANILLGSIAVSGVVALKGVGTFMNKFSKGIEFILSATGTFGKYFSYFICDPVLWASLATAGLAGVFGASVALPLSILSSRLTSSMVFGIIGALFTNRFSQKAFVGSHLIGNGITYFLADGSYVYDFNRLGVFIVLLNGFSILAIQHIRESRQADRETPLTEHLSKGSAHAYDVARALLTLKEEFVLLDNTPQSKEHERSVLDAAKVLSELDPKFKNRPISTPNEVRESFKDVLKITKEALGRITGEGDPRERPMGLLDQWKLRAYNYLWAKLWSMMDSLWSSYVETKVISSQGSSISTRLDAIFKSASDISKLNPAERWRAYERHVFQVLGAFKGFVTDLLTVLDPSTADTIVNLVSYNYKLALSMDSQAQDHARGQVINPPKVSFESILDRFMTGQYTKAEMFWLQNNLKVEDETQREYQPHNFIGTGLLSQQSAQATNHYKGRESEFKQQLREMLRDSVEVGFWTRRHCNRLPFSIQMILLAVLYVYHTTDTEYNGEECLTHYMKLVKKVVRLEPSEAKFQLYPIPPSIVKWNKDEQFHWKHWGEKMNITQALQSLL